MSRFLKWMMPVLAVWLLSGVYIVESNQRAAVRRFGKAVHDAEGHLVLRRNGLHYDWPWPFSQIDRLNLNEVRTLTIPAKKTQREEAPQQLIGPEDPEFVLMTGDKNLLNVALTVQYRIHELRVREFFYGSRAVEDRLFCLTEAVATELFAASGVDFVQVSGLAELRQRLGEKLQHRADEQQLGVVIEEVSLDDISPPVQVKADFLDVANARAEREQFIQAALSEAEQRKQSAQAEAREIRDAAQSDAQNILQTAQGSAARFSQIIAQFHAPEDSSNSSSTGRRLALERYYFQTMAEILERVKGKVVLDSGQPIDLSIWRSLDSEERQEPSPSGNSRPQ